VTLGAGPVPVPAGAGLRTARRLALGALALALAGCVSEGQEQKIGDRVAAQVNAQVPMVHDPVLNAYVSTLGLSITRHSDRPGVRYHFYIVDTGQVNAFALPGGHVYINRGLIERTRSQSELAAVIAHEVAHVAARHGARNLQRQLRTSSLVSILYEMILGRQPEILDQDALNLGGALWSASNSRAEESEADQLAVKYLIRTGVDPHGMVHLLRRLIKEEKGNAQPGAQVAWFASHPTTESRLRNTEREIRADLPTPAPRLSMNTAAFPAFLARLHQLPPPPIPVPLPVPTQ
jgi:predicted Zn-dependent protease